MHTSQHKVIYWVNRLISMTTINYYRNTHRTTDTTPSMIPALMILTMIVLFVLGFNHSIDESLSNRKAMLCNSATVSGNTEYLAKCQCYYATSDISCVKSN